MTEIDVNVIIGFSVTAITALSGVIAVLYKRTITLTDKSFEVQEISMKAYHEAMKMQEMAMKLMCKNQGV